MWRWAVLCAVLAVPLGIAANSPQLAWRDPVYIVAGFAGVIGLCVMLIQPLLIAGALPGQRLHRWLGGLLVLCVVAHVAALWITSPPDVVDALIFASPTQFSVWGVIAMWAIFAAATLAAVRKRLGLRIWRLAHTGLVSISVIGVIVHALLIEGTMGQVSKAALCILVAAACLKAVKDRRVWSRPQRR